MAEFITVSDAKAQLTRLVRDADDTDVVLTKHGAPAAVILSARRHADLLEQLDDLEDRLAAYESASEPTIAWDKLKAEMGWE